MMNDRRGQIRIVEAFLAVLVIFSAFAVSANFTVSQDPPLREDLSDVGVRALASLDHDGILGRLIEDGNFTDLRDSLILLLPSAVSFNLTVYDENMNQVNTEIIANGGLGNQQVSFAQYVCASPEPTFHVYFVHLWLVRAT